MSAIPIRSEIVPGCKVKIKPAGAERNFRYGELIEWLGKKKGSVKMQSGAIMAISTQRLAIHRGEFPPPLTPLPMPVEDAPAPAIVKAAQVAPPAERPTPFIQTLADPSPPKPTAPAPVVYVVVDTGTGFVYSGSPAHHWYEEPGRARRFTHDGQANKSISIFNKRHRGKPEFQGVVSDAPLAVVFEKMVPAIQAELAARRAAGNPSPVKVLSFGRVEGINAPATVIAPPPPPPQHQPSLDAFQILREAVERHEANIKHVKWLTAELMAASNLTDGLAGEVEKAKVLLDETIRDGVKSK